MLYDNFYMKHADVYKYFVRYFIVIDDLWDMSVWNIVRHTN